MSVLERFNCSCLVFRKISFPQSSTQGREDGKGNLILFLLPFCCTGNGTQISIDSAEGSPVKSGQVHISSSHLSLNNNSHNDFLAEALEALLNRIQVDIEVDSNLKGLKKGKASVSSRTVCGLHGSRQRKKKRKKGTECLLFYKKCHNINFHPTNLPCPT